MALKLTLSPNEKLVINGAVVQNADRRTTLVIQNKAAILREKDIMLPDQANTPMRRVYFAIMMMYLDEKSQKQFYDDFFERITEFMNAIQNPDALGFCAKIIQLVHAKEYYKALLSCRKLYEFEEVRLNYVPPELPASTERD
jgi:flagellar protein FlbT